MKLGDAMPGQKQLAEAALAELSEPNRSFYEPQFRIDRDYGKFVGLVCRACNRWLDFGHAEDCPATKVLQ